MLALMEENHQRRAAAAAMGDARPTERTGMCTTALVVQVGERTSCLYDSGRAHAGENLKALLAQRQAGLEKPLVLSDALSRHTAAADGLMRCHCLAHGRRQCSEREDVLPDECTVVITARKEVFDHDAQARAQQRSAEER